VLIVPRTHENNNMNKELFELEDLSPLSDFAPKFAKWLEVVDRAQGDAKNYDVMRYYGQSLTGAEAVFCGSYARHVVLGHPAPNLEEGSFDCSPMYRQALLEKIVRERLKQDNYVFPLAVKV